MSKERFIIAVIGLLLLGICAWCCVCKSNSWRHGNNLVNQSNERNLEVVECDNKQDYTMVGKMETLDYSSDSNVESPIQMEIKPKHYQYRNASRKLLLTQSEYDTLLRIVEAEATYGSLKSKRMVANVVLNRVVNDKFPNNVNEVVFQKLGNGVSQFSPISDGRYYDVKVSKATVKAVKQVLKGKDESGGALFFMNANTAARNNVVWFQNHLTYLFDCGGHSFYRF